MISIVLVTFMISIALFYLTLLHLFIIFYFEYLPLFIHHSFFGTFLTRFKWFKAFWPSSLTSMLVKGVDKLWKVRGIIGGFNELRRQIASGVK